MNPPIITEPRPLGRHPQRPWRPVEPPRDCLSCGAPHAFTDPVVRELPPRREPRSPAW